MAEADREHEMQMARLSLERSRFRADILKWLIIAVGAVVSFVVIDYGRLRLEEFRATAENERALLKAYLDAGDAQAPEIWVRKLQVIRTLATDPNLRSWAEGEVRYIRDCAAKEAAYRETLKVAALLLRPDEVDRAEYREARRAFERLYWADLPYVEESERVERAMIKFRNALVDREKPDADAAGDTTGLNAAMIDLAGALRADDPRGDAACRRGGGS